MATGQVKRTRKMEQTQMDTIDSITWLAPWQPVHAPGLGAELQKEVSAGHPLYRQDAVAVGHRCDCDDVLFFLPKNTLPYAVVHLTWSGKAERVDWPATTLYASLEDWITRGMQRDHQTYAAETRDQHP
jgi:hypothetical protein